MSMHNVKQRSDKEAPKAVTFKDKNLPQKKQDFFNNLREKSNNSQPQSKISGEIMFSQV